MTKSDPQFTCPTCGEHDLEEVSQCECVISKIIEIHNDGGPSSFDLEYSEPQLTGDSFVLRYQCSNCGFTLKDGDEITSVEELIEWLEDHAEKG